MKNYDAHIRGYSLEDVFPEKVNIDDNNTLLFRDAKVIFTEYDKNIDPMVEAPLVKGFYVGVRVTASVRTFSQNGGICSLTEKPVQYGEFVALSNTATLKDVVESINELAVKVRDKIVGEPFEA